MYIMEALFLSAMCTWVDELQQQFKFSPKADATQGQLIQYWRVRLLIIYLSIKNLKSDN